MVTHCYPGPTLDYQHPSPVTATEGTCLGVPYQKASPHCEADSRAGPSLGHKSKGPQVWLLLSSAHHVNWPCHSCPPLTVAIRSQCRLPFSKSSAGLGLSLPGHMLSHQRHPGSTSSTVRCLLLGPEVLCCPSISASAFVPGTQGALAFVSTGVAHTQHRGDSQEVPCAAVA